MCRQHTHMRIQTCANSILTRSHAHTNKLTNTHMRKQRTQTHKHDTHMCKQRTHTHAIMHTYTHVQTANSHARTHTHKCTHVQTAYSNTHERTHTCANSVLTHTHTHTQKQTQKNTHTHMCKRNTHTREYSNFYVDTHIARSTEMAFVVIPFQQCFTCMHARYKTNRLCRCGD